VPPPKDAVGSDGRPTPLLLCEIKGLFSIVELTLVNNVVLMFSLSR
jgi:hypothetical protein